MMKRKVKQKLAFMMAVVLSITAVASGSSFVNAADMTSAVKDLILYDAEQRTDLEADEVVEAEDITVYQGESFDAEKNFTGIRYTEDKVKVSYNTDKSNFNSAKPGTYDTYYTCEPVSEKTAYLVCRKITVETKTDSEETAENKEEESSEEEEAEPDNGLVGDNPDFEDYPLAEGEIETLQSAVSTMTIQYNEPVLYAVASASGTEKMKVSYSGYAKYCGHSMGIKYISSSGDYKNRLVYCLNLGKNTTNGTVELSGSKIKPEITFCMVNGARKLGETCHTSKYSAGSASADYFVTSAAIHILNGEVKSSYYNDGSKVYKRICSMVADAKNYDEEEYDAATGRTISIKYSITPKKTDWKSLGDGLYRSTEKFVRTKSGTITDVKYTITGAPSGLTVGEIKTDSSDIDNTDDLKKYDICVAQTDASKASSNFYLYCNEEAMKKIIANKSTIKVTAKAYANEKGGRKWTPTVVSQQKITFLEDFSSPKTASVKVTTDYQLGSFELYKTDTYSGKPVDGATYYLYEDAACSDLLCKLSKTSGGGLGKSEIQTLTQSTYYLKEVKEADGYECDSTVYPVGLEYFTLYDSNGNVTQKGKVMNVKENPLPVSVSVRKKDSDSGNTIKNAGFAVFKDAACTQRVVVNEGKDNTVVPVFHYDEDVDMAVSASFYKHQDTYYIKEVEVPDGYVDSGKVYPVKPDLGECALIEMDNTPVRCDVDVIKKDKETDSPQGDAKLSGAIYGLYAKSQINYPDGRGVVTYGGTDDITSTKGTNFQSTGAKAVAGALLATVETDENSEFNFGNLYYGNYYVKEIKESEGYLLDSTEYSVDYTKESNTHVNLSVKRNVVETVKKQAFEIIKVSTDGSDAETDYVEGAEFTVKLQSEIDEKGWDAAATYDVLATDKNGYACSKELPYGTYLVKETKVPEDLYKTDDFQVVINEDSREPQEWRVLNDSPFKAYLKIVKRDAETGEIIQIPGVTFKIKNEDGDYVEQKVGNDKISEFVTDETGTVTTPLQLKYGNYTVEEITAPNGYLLSEESYPIRITKTGAVQVEEDEDGDAVIAVEIADTPVKGSISVLKKGEVLVSAEYDTIVDRILSEVTDDERSVTFQYEEQPLEGAVYNLVAAENIYTPDCQLDEEGKRKLEVINGIPATEGAVVATLITDENGEAGIEDLPLGKYRIEEASAPFGFVLCEEAKEIELTYADNQTEVVYENAEFINQRVKTSLSLVKTNATNEVPVSGATYGVYAAEDIPDAEGEVLVEADSLVDSAVTDAEGKAVFDADLPFGLYYVKEIATAPGYLMDENRYDVDFSYQDSKTALLTKELEVKEAPIIVEVSKTDITTGKELKDAKLEILDENGEVYAAWTTDGTPYQINAIPAGDYTLRETFAPYGYRIANEVEFTVEETGEIQKVAMNDERIKGCIEIYKTDKSTKKPIEGVEFELRDADGKVIATLVTDKDGYAKTELLDIATYNEDGSYKEDIHYFVVESKTANGYILDKKVHDIVLKYADEAPEVVVYQLNVKNKPEKTPLPQTGGNYNSWVFLLVGGAVITGGLVYFRKRKRK